MASKLGFLTDEELRTKLRSFNLPDGPITKTTRKLFEAQLARAMGVYKQVNKPTESQKQEAKTSFDQGTTNINGHVEISMFNVQSTSGDKGCQQNAVHKEACTFYGVCLDNGSACESVGSKCISVFTDRNEALHCVKKNNGARFRSFSTRNEAEAFASGKLRTPSRLLSQELSPGPVEPTSDYKTPKGKGGEITTYRQLIEKGDLDNVAKLIYGNPKYLISSGDTPFIIQEGCHYNSMHVAAKAGHRDICKLVVDTLNDDEFWKLMYPVKVKGVNNVELNNRRKAFLLDLYVNTPDKGVSIIINNPLRYIYTTILQ